MSETLQPLGQWDTAIDKDGYLWVSPDGLGWAKFVRRGHGVTFHPRDVAAYGLARTPISTELESLREEVARYRVDAVVRDVVADASARREERDEYVTRDELAEKLDEVRMEHGPSRRDWHASDDDGPIVLPPDLTPWLTFDVPHCGATNSRGLICTRLLGHTGRHAAGDGQHIVAVWADPA